MKKFKARGHATLQADADADALICKVAIDIAKEGKMVVDVGEHIDLLCLLVAGTSPTGGDIIFLKGGKGTQPQHTYSIHDIQTENPMWVNNILFAHTISGCDTVSAFYSKGKFGTFKKIQKKDTAYIAEIFNDLHSTKEVICTAATQYVLLLYNAPLKIKFVKDLRYFLFMRSASKTSVYLASLSLTVDAIHLHALHAYHQIQVWRGNEPPPLQYGWYREGGQLLPTRMSTLLAPQDLSKIISCACLKGCLSACSCCKAGQSIFVMNYLIFLKLISRFTFQASNVHNCVQVVWGYHV